MACILDLKNLMNLLGGLIKSKQHDWKIFWMLIFKVCAGNVAKNSYLNLDRETTFYDTALVDVEQENNHLVSTLLYR